MRLQMAEIVVQGSDQPCLAAPLDKPETCHQYFKRDGIVADGAICHILRSNLGGIDVARQTRHLRLQEFDGEKYFPKHGSRGTLIRQSVDQERLKLTLLLPEDYRRVQKCCNGSGEAACILRKNGDMIGEQSVS